MCKKGTGYVPIRPLPPPHLYPEVDYQDSHVLVPTGAYEQKNFCGDTPPLVSDAQGAYIYCSYPPVSLTPVANEKNLQSEKF
jgi:hypothetical protein